MKFVEKLLTIQEINNFEKEFGDYFKITADTENGFIVVGCKLHAGGEKILLEKGSKQENIW